MRFGKSLVQLCAALPMLILAIAAIHIAFAGAPQTRTAKSVMLIYVGAKNCAPCEAWQRTEATDFRASPEFSRLLYRVVESPSLRDVLNDANWPQDLLIYRDKIDKNSGVPLWMVVADGRLVHQDFGLSQWHRTVFPMLAELLHSSR